MSSFPKTGTGPPEGEGKRYAPTQPSTLLVSFSHFIPPNGLALDLACGNGRNTLFLARRGLAAVGIDRSGKALAQAREAADHLNLKVALVQADLTRFTLSRNSFSAVICFKYRDRNLYPSIRAAIRPGGLFIAESYTREQLQYAQKPRNPAHLLERNELLQAFGDWEIIFYHEVWKGSGTASLVARKPLSPAEC